MAVTNLIINSLLTLHPVQNGFLLEDIGILSDNQTAIMETLAEPPVQKSETRSDYQLLKMFNYSQAVYLIYQDIYVYTKPGLYKTHIVDGLDIRNNEMNPVANLFFKNNLWDLAFISANVFNYLIYSDDDLYYIYSVLLSMAEVWAISTWDGTSTQNMNVSATVFALTF